MRALRPTVAGCVVVAFAALIAGCGIDPDAGPREVPVEQRLDLVPEDVVAGQSTGAARVFLLSDADNGGLLRSVLRDVPARPTDVLQALFAGPNDEEIEAGLQTALPADLQVLSVRQVAGTLNVDLSSQILELQGTAPRLAVAQIVFTASELEGVETVRLRVDGQNREWPSGRGDLQSRALSVYDYPGTAESALPDYPPIPASTVP